MTDVYLYLLNMPGTNLYKIGVSARPCQRLEQVASRRHAVKIVRVWPGLASFEKRLHAEYGAKRVREHLEDLPASGRTEWFRLSSDDVSAILAACYCEELKAKELDKARRRARFDE